MEAAEQLPRGRHRLSRAEVERSQRSRMLRAIAEAVGERGYANTPVAEVLNRAGVSRETFYEHFANKEECFLASYDGATAILLAEIAGTDRGEGTPSIEAALERYLAALAREPAVARTFLIEVYAAGPRALERRVEVQRRFADALAAAVGATGERQRFTCEALVASVSALVTQRLCTDGAGELEELTGPLARYARATLAAEGMLE